MSKKHTAVVAVHTFTGKIPGDCDRIMIVGARIGKSGREYFTRESPSSENITPTIAANCMLDLMKEMPSLGKCDRIQLHLLQHLTREVSATIRTRTVVNDITPDEYMALLFEHTNPSKNQTVERDDLAKSGISTFSGLEVAAMMDGSRK